MRGFSEKSVMKNYKRIISVVLLIAVTICSVLSTGLEARAADVTESNPMYRLYNPNSGEHFYTADEGERDYLSVSGWNYESIGWFAPVSSNSPVYRLYNPYSSDHHYTMDEGEKDYLSQTGWNYEGIGWYSDDAKTVPLYRQFNPNVEIGAHNYTKSLEENDWLCTIGWQAEGIGWYGVSNNWREAYIDYICNELGDDSIEYPVYYALVYVDNDDIPEILLGNLGGGGHGGILVYTDDKVSINAFARSDVEYLPKEGLFYGYSGLRWVDWHSVYKIENGQLQELANGGSELNETTQQFDKYELNGVPSTKQVVAKTIAKMFGNSSIKSTDRKIIIYNSKARTILDEKTYYRNEIIDILSKM